MGGVGAIMQAQATVKATQANANATIMTSQEATKQYQEMTKQAQLQSLAEKEKSKGLLGSAEFSMKSALENNKTLIIGIVAVSVVAVLGIGAYLYISKIKAVEPSIMPPSITPLPPVHTL